MVYFPKAPRARVFPAGLQSEPDTEAAHNPLGANLLINMRKEEPKVVLKTGGKHSRGERPQPGADPRYLYADPHTADRQPAPACSRLNAPIHSRGLMRFMLAGPRYSPRQSHRVGDSRVYAEWAWGNLCQANCF